MFTVRSAYRMMIRAKKTRENYLEGSLMWKKDIRNGNNCGI
jgi:hypothetical protein